MRAPGSALAVAWALVPALIWACLAPSHCRRAAQEDAAGTSYINPFPPGDVYKLQAYGDAFAEGLLAGLTSRSPATPACSCSASIARSAALLAHDFEDEMRAEEAPGREPCTSASS